MSYEQILKRIRAAAVSAFEAAAHAEDVSATVVVPCNVGAGLEAVIRVQIRNKPAPPAGIARLREAGGKGLPPT